MRVEERSGDRLARKVRTGQLLEIYGELLTERQREFVRLHHNEDLSLGEIAREYSVSRQAVHDAVRQAEVAMERFEQRLGLLTGRPVRATVPVGGGLETETPGQADDGVERQDQSLDSPELLAQLADNDEFRSVVQDLEGIRRRLSTQGVIYDVGNHVRALDEVITRLKHLLGFEQTVI